jgi:penicillin-binding protein 2
MDSEKSALHRRILVLRLVLAGLFLILLARLWQLQILHGAEYEHAAWQNRIRTILTMAPRGVVYAAGKEILATSRAAYAITILPCQFQEPELELRRLAQLIDLDAGTVATIRQKLKDRRLPPFQSVVVKEDVDVATLARLEEERITLPGVLVENRPVRFYPHGSLAAHVIGYVGQISALELQYRRSPQYLERVGQRYGQACLERFEQRGMLQFSLNDIVGKAGVEKTYDVALRGWGGGQRVVVNARGEVVEPLPPEPAVPGGNVYLTLDLKLQEVAEKALQGRVGAVVAVDVQNGAVRVLASSPTYDPNVFIPPTDGKVLRGLLDHPRQALMNRAVRAYPPGSTFKLVTASAALTHGAISPRTVVYCGGGYRKGRWFGCWRAHGAVNLRSAIAASCDVYFYRAAEAMGPEALQRTARDFGLGEPTGLDLPGEVPGLIPTAAWMQAHEHRRWYGGDTLNMAIGQGAVSVTPLQMALVAAAVANGGLLFQPQLVERIVDGEGQEIYTFRPKVRRRVQVPAEVLELVRQGMYQAVYGRGGTGAGVQIPGVSIAGKTGSAETQGHAHAWFVSFAPYDHPRLACAVIVEHGRHGSEAAVPITRQIFQAAFGSEKSVEERTVAAVSNRDR